MRSSRNGPEILTRYAEGLFRLKQEEESTYVGHSGPFGIAHCCWSPVVPTAAEAERVKMIHVQICVIRNSALFLVQSKSMYATFY